MRKYFNVTPPHQDQDIIFGRSEQPLSKTKTKPIQISQKKKGGIQSRDFHSD